MVVLLLALLEFLLRLWPDPLTKVPIVEASRITVTLVCAKRGRGLSLSAVAAILPPNPPVMEPT